MKNLTKKLRNYLIFTFVVAVVMAIAGILYDARVIPFELRSKYPSPACFLGCAEQCFQLGQREMKNRDFKAAVRYFRKGCKLSQEGYSCSSLAVALQLSGNDRGAIEVEQMLCSQGRKESCVNVEREKLRGTKREQAFKEGCGRKTVSCNSMLDFYERRGLEYTPEASRDRKKACLTGFEKGCQGIMDLALKNPRKNELEEVFSFFCENQDTFARHGLKKCQTFAIRQLVALGESKTQEIRQTSSSINQRTADLICDVGAILCCQFLEKHLLKGGKSDAAARALEKWLLADNMFELLCENKAIIEKVGYDLCLQLGESLSEKDKEETVSTNIEYQAVAHYVFNYLCEKKVAKGCSWVKRLQEGVNKSFSEKKFTLPKIEGFHYALQSRLASEKLLYARRVIHPEKKECPQKESGTSPCLERRFSTTLHLFDPITRKSKKVFDTVAAHIELMDRYGSGNSPIGVIVAAQGKAYAIARSSNDGISSHRRNPGRLFELSLDGANKIREIAKIKSSGPLTRIFINRQGTLIGYERSIFYGKRYNIGAKRGIVIHDVKTGKITHEIQVGTIDHDFRSPAFIPKGNKIIVVQVPFHDSPSKEKARFVIIDLDKKKDMVSQISDESLPLSLELYAGLTSEGDFLFIKRTFKPETYYAMTVSQDFKLKESIVLEQTKKYDSIYSPFVGSKFIAYHKNGHKVFVKMTRELFIKQRKGKETIRVASHTRPSIDPRKKNKSKPDLKKLEKVEFGIVGWH